MEKPSEIATLLKALQGLSDADFNSIVVVLDAEGHITRQAGFIQRTVELVEWAKKQPEGLASIYAGAKALGSRLNLGIHQPLASIGSLTGLPPLAIPNERTGMSDRELIDFYQNEKPLTVRLGGEDHILPVTLVIEPTARRVELEPIQFTISPDSFRPPSRIEPYVSAIRSKILEEPEGKRHYDGLVASLRSLRPSGSGWVGEVCEGSYFDALATNFRGMDFQPEGEPFTLRKLLSRKTRALEALEESVLVNHLGFVCLIESSDGKLVVQQRSASVANRTNTLSASVTGSVSFPDVADIPGRAPEADVPLAQLVSGAGLRETYFELGIRLTDLRFLGLIREFERGGKPELYFYARSPRSFVEIANSRSRASEWHETKGLVPFGIHTQDADSDEELETRLHDSLKAAIPEGNLTLQAGILLLAKALLESDHGGAS